MGNIGSINNRQRNRNGNHNRNPSPPSHSLSPSPQLGINGNIYVFASATPYPTQFSNSNPLQYYQNSNYYHPSPMSMPLPPADAVHANWMNRCPCGPTPHSPAPYVEHQKAVTIKSDVNLKKETLRVEPNEQNPGRFLVAFTFDATVARRREQRIAYVFFTKNGRFYIFDFMVYLGCIKILLLVSFYRIICYNGCFLRVLVSIYLVSPCICWLAIFAW